MMKLIKKLNVFLLLFLGLFLGLSFFGKPVAADEERNIWLEKDCGWHFTNSVSDIQYDDNRVYICSRISNGGSITLYKGTRYYVGSACQIIPDSGNPNTTIHFQRYSISSSEQNIALTQLGIFYCDYRTGFCIDANEYGKSTVSINVTTYNNHGGVEGTEIFSFDVYVVEPISAIQVDPVEMYVGDSVPFVLKGVTRNTCFSNEYVPLAGMYNPLLLDSYASNDEMVTATSVAIFARKSGIATISLTYHDSFNLPLFNPATNSNVPYAASNPSTMFTIDIYDKIKSISFNELEKNLNVGETCSQEPIIEADGDGRIKKEIEWSSSDSDVATVDETGKVVTLKGGTANIKATSKDTGRAEGCYVVNVIEPTSESNNNENGNNTAKPEPADEANASNSNGRVASITSTAAAIPKISNVKAKIKRKKAVITWTSVGDAYQYVIYRANKKNGKFEKVGAVSGSVYTDTKIKYGNTYCYKIEAVSLLKPQLSSPLSDSSNVVTLLPATPKIKSIKKIGGRYILKVKGKGKGYAVYAGKKKNSKQFLATISGNSATLSLKGTYYVRCKSFIKVGKKRVYSKYSKAKKVVFK